MALPVELPHPYVARDVLGRSSQSVTVRATEGADGPAVVVKVMQPAAWLDASESAAVRARLLVAMEALTGLRHPYIAPVLEVGTMDDAVYMVREFVEGDALDAVLARQRCLPVEDVAQIVRQVACALDALAGFGYPHGAVAAGNVILTPRGARLTDAAFSHTAGAFQVGGVQCQLQRAGSPGDDIVSLALLTAEIAGGSGAGRDASSIASAYGIPAPLRRFIARGLSSGRFREIVSATAFAQALFAEERRRRFTRRVQVGTGVAIAGALVLLVAPTLYLGSTRVSQPAVAHSIAPVKASGTPSRVERLEWIHQAARREGPLLLAQLPVAHALGLRADQLAAVSMCVQEHRAAVRNIMDTPAAGHEDDRLSRVGLLRRAARIRILSILDPVQRERWDEFEREDGPEEIARTARPR